MFFAHAKVAFLTPSDKQNEILNVYNTRWFKYDRDDLCANKSPFVPVIFEPPCNICKIKSVQHVTLTTKFYAGFWLENLTEGKCPEGLGVNTRIILKLIFNK
jgi:hypothetical protein